MCLVGFNVWGVCFVMCVLCVSVVCGCVCVLCGMCGCVCVVFGVCVVGVVCVLCVWGLFCLYV